MDARTRSLPFEPEAVAAALVRARLGAQALHAYPGALPPDFATAYACQDRAIELWPERIVGWKVGYVAPHARDRSGDTRLLGPVFRDGLRLAQADMSIAFPVFDGGFAAVEAEFVFQLAHAADPSRTEYSAEQAAELVGAMYVGIETAGSPLATINALGPAVVISDFGNNAGLIVGPAIPGWRERSPASLCCETFVDGASVGRSAGDTLEDGPLGAFAFALGRLAARGRTAKAGDYITTGAVTGIHAVRAGQGAHVVFDGIATLRCHAVAASART